MRVDKGLDMERRPNRSEARLCAPMCTNIELALEPACGLSGYDDTPHFDCALGCTTRVNAGGAAKQKVEK